MTYCGHIFLFFPFWYSFSFILVHSETDSGTIGGLLCFNEVAISNGIHFRHTDGRHGEKYYLETPGSGLAWFDYDNDGDSDLYFVNSTDVSGRNSVPPSTNALYRNNGNGSFTDVTVDAGVNHEGYGFGCCVGDYDNDGFKDIYITNFGVNVLYHNNGNGTFTGVTKEAGVGDEQWSTGAAFADYDRDGDLDLFVANYVEYRLEDDPICYWVSSRFDNKSDAWKPRKKNTFHSPLLVRHRIYCLPKNFEGAPDVFYRNNGDGTFTDVTHESGLGNLDGKGLGAVWSDYDNDGDADLFVANDTTPNMLYQNKNDGTFVNVALHAGVVAVGKNGIPLSGMGTSFGDYNNDGKLDLVVTNFENDPNCLYRNNGDGTFSDETYSSGVGKNSLPYLAWGVGFLDLDNSGHQDMFVANGHIDDNVKVYTPSAAYAQQNQIFLNLGDSSFREISNQCGPGLQLKKVSRGAAFADYDNDGDIDIAISNSNQTPDLLQNDSDNQNHWLIIETVGTTSNRDGIGTRVTIVTEGGQQIREVKSGSSYLCQNDMRLHFGLGNAEMIDEVMVRWPSGLVEQFKNVKGDQFLRATEGEGLTVAHIPKSW